MNASAQVSFEWERAEAPVDEGGSYSVRVRLTEMPSRTVGAVISRISGDTDITIDQGASLTIVRDQWATWRTVTFSAAEDADEINGEAIFEASESGSTAGVLPATVKLIEVENDGLIEVGGTLAGNVVWDTVGRDYLITSQVVVPAGASLSVRPGVRVQHRATNFGAILVDGGAMDAESATFLLSTFARSNTSRLHGIVFRGDATGSFEDCIFGLTERSQYSPNYFVDWAAGLSLESIADESPTVTVLGGEFYSTGVVDFYDTAHAAYVDSGSTLNVDRSTGGSVPLLSRMHGTFRAQFSSDLQLNAYAPQDITQTRIVIDPVTLSGNVVWSEHAAIIGGQLTVANGASLTLDNGADLLLSGTGGNLNLNFGGRVDVNDAALSIGGRTIIEGQLFAMNSALSSGVYNPLIVNRLELHGSNWTSTSRAEVTGDVVATDSMFAVATTAGTSLNDGFWFKDLSVGRFTDCEFVVTESNVNANYYTNRSAAIYAASESSVIVEGTSFVSSNSISGRRASYGMLVEGASSAEVKSGTSGPCSFTGFLGAIHWDFVTASLDYDTSTVVTDSRGICRTGGTFVGDYTFDGIDLSILTAATIPSESSMTWNGGVATWDAGGTVAGTLDLNGARWKTGAITNVNGQITADDSTIETVASGGIRLQSGSTMAVTGSNVTSLSPAINNGSIAIDALTGSSLTMIDSRFESEVNPNRTKWGVAVRDEATLITQNVEFAEFENGIWWDLTSPVPVLENATFTNTRMYTPGNKTFSGEVDFSGINWYIESRVYMVSGSEFSLRDSTLYLRTWLNWGPNDGGTHHSFTLQPGSAMQLDNVEVFVDEESDHSHSYWTRWAAAFRIQGSGKLSINDSAVKGYDPDSQGYKPVLAISLDVIDQPTEPVTISGTTSFQGFHAAMSWGFTEAYPIIGDQVEFLDGYPMFSYGGTLSTVVDQPNYDMYVYGRAYLADGSSLKLRNGTLRLRTYLNWGPDDGGTQHGFTLQSGSEMSLDNVEVFVDEESDHSHSYWERWAAAFRIQGSGKLSIHDSAVKGYDPDSQGYKPVLAISLDVIDQPTEPVTISGTTSFQGFHAAINWGFTDGYPVIGDQVEFLDGYPIFSYGGTLSTVVDQANYDMYVFGRAYLANGSSLKLRNGRLKLRTSATDGPNHSNTQHGLTLQSGSVLELDNMEVLVDEESSHSTSPLSRWAAAFRAQGNAKLVLNDSAIKSYDPDDQGYIPVFAVSVDQSDLPTEPVTVSGATTFEGFFAAINWGLTGGVPVIGDQVTFIDGYQVFSYGGLLNNSETIENFDLHISGRVEIPSGSNVSIINSTLRLTTVACASGPDGTCVQHAISITGTGELSLDNVTVYIDEEDDFNTISSGDWAAGIRVLEQGRLSANDSQFIGYDPDLQNYVPTIGVSLEGELPATFAGEVRFENLGYGIMWRSVDVAAPEVLGNLEFIDAGGVFSFGGTLSSIAQLSNLDLYVFGNVASTETGGLMLSDSILTVTGTVNVPEESTFLFEDSQLSFLRQFNILGTAQLVSCQVASYTYADGNPSSRRSGFEVTGSGRLELLNSTLRGIETRTRGDSNSGAAIVEATEGARVLVDGCYFTNAKGENDVETRFALRAEAPTGELVMRNSTVTGFLVGLAIKSVPASFFVEDNSFAENINAVWNYTTTEVQAYRNYWGSPTGPTHKNNPSGTGDIVSDYVDYGIFESEPPNDGINLVNPATGQERNKLAEAPASLANVELIGFRIPVSGSTLERIEMRLDVLAGIDFDADLSNVRLVGDLNGDGNIGAEDSASPLVPRLLRDGLNLRVVIDGPVVSSTPNESFILLADFANLEENDGLIASMNTFGTYGPAGVPVINSVSPVTHRHAGLITLANRLGGQEGNAFNGLPNQPNVELFGFHLYDGIAANPVTELAFRLRAVGSIAPENFTDLRLIHDTNGDGNFQAGEPVVADSYELTAGADTIDVTLTGSIVADGSFLLLGSFERLLPSAHFTVHLESPDIIAAPIEVVGTVLPASHFVDTPYYLADSPYWIPPQNFGLSTGSSGGDSLSMPLLGFTLYPRNRSINGIEFSLENVLGIVTADITNARIVWDENRNGVVDAAETVVASGGIVNIDRLATSGSISFPAGFELRGEYILVADVSNLEHGDELTIEARPELVSVPAGLTVAGSSPTIRHAYLESLEDSGQNRAKWTLAYRSPGGSRQYGRFNGAGDKVIVGYSSGTAYIYDSQTNTPLMAFKDHYDSIRYAGFDASDSRAVIVTRDGVVYIRDVATGDLVDSFFSDLLVERAFPSFDLTKLFVITAGKGILLDINTREVLWEFVRDDGGLLSATFSPDGQYILLGHENGRAYLVDVTTGDDVDEYLGHTQGVTGVAFTGDGQVILTAGRESLVQVWQLFGNTPLDSITLGGDARGAAMSADGKQVAVVQRFGNVDQLLLLDGDNLEVRHAVDLATATGGRWGGTLVNLAFSTDGSQVIVTSLGNGNIANFDVESGNFVTGYGPRGNFGGFFDRSRTYEAGRVPQISADGQRIFYMTDAGLQIVPREMGIPITEPLVSLRSYDINKGGNRISYFDGDNLIVQNVTNDGLTTIVNKNVGFPTNYISMSDSGGKVVVGDRIYSATTGDLLADYQIPNLTSFGAVSPNGAVWGFPDPTTKDIITVRGNDPDARLLYQVDSSVEFAQSQLIKVLFDQDATHVYGIGNLLTQSYVLGEDQPAGLYQLTNIVDANLSDDGTMMAIAAGGVSANQVRIVSNLTSTQSQQRVFFPQTSDILSMKAVTAQFTRADSEIMFAWNHNYIEIYKRTAPESLVVYPPRRRLVPGQDQRFTVKVTFDDTTSADVTPLPVGQLPSPIQYKGRAILEIDPPEAAMLTEGNLVTVAENRTEPFVVRGLYRENGKTVIAESLIEIGQGPVVALSVTPETATLSPGAFRELKFIATYEQVADGEDNIQNGFQEDVTDRVVLSTDRPLEMELGTGNGEVRFLRTARPGEAAVTGEFTDRFGNKVSATAVLATFGRETEWERYRVTSGGGIEDGDYNPAGTLLAISSKSGAVSIYDVDVTPNQYKLRTIIQAFESPSLLTQFLNNNTILTVSRDGYAKWWDIDSAENGPIDSKFLGEEIEVVALDTARLNLAIGERGGSVSLFDLTTKTVEWRSFLHVGPVLSIFATDDLVVTGGQDNRGKVINKSDGVLIQSLFTHLAPITGVAAIPDAVGTERIFLISEDTLMSIWVESTEPDFGAYIVLDTFQLYGVPEAITVAGSDLYIATDTDETFVYDREGLLLRSIYHPAPESKISSILVDPTGSYLLTGRTSVMGEISYLFGLLSFEVPRHFGSVQFWENKRGVFRGSLAQSHPLVDAHMGDTNTVFTQSSKRTLEYSFDPILAAAQEIRLMETGFFVDANFSGMDFTLASDLLATRLGPSIYLFDTIAKNIRKTVHTPDLGLSAYAISASGTILATSSSCDTPDRQTRAFDTANLQPLRQDSRIARNLDFLRDDFFLGPVLACPGDPSPDRENAVIIWRADANTQSIIDIEKDPEEVIRIALKVDASETGDSVAVLTRATIDCGEDAIKYRYYLELYDLTPIPAEEALKLAEFELYETVCFYPAYPPPLPEFVFDVARDGNLAVVGNDLNPVVRLIDISRNMDLREFLPPAGREDIGGAAAVEFGNEDETIMVGYKEGFAELHRRLLPSRLDLLVGEDTLIAGAERAGRLRSLIRPKQNAVMVSSGQVLQLVALATYENGGDVIVTPSTSITFDPPGAATLEGGNIRIGDHPPGTTITVNGSYTELGTAIQATPLILQIDGVTGRDRWEFR